MNLQALTDKAAIALSLACAAHCLLLPVALVLAPAFAATSLGGEAFHRWMLVGVLPASLVALTMGCKNHRRYSVGLLGLVGLAVLGIAALWSHEMFGETVEKSMTLVGGFIIVLGHVLNQKLCREHACDC